MITVTLQAEIQRSIPAENAYTVSFLIINAMNIPFEVFVFKTEGDTFSHVGTVYDLETFPAGKTAAVTNGFEFYRERGAIVTYSTAHDATGFESVTRSRLKILTNAWSSVVEDFESSEIISIVSPSA